MFMGENLERKKKPQSHMFKKGKKGKTTSVSQDFSQERWYVIWREEHRHNCNRLHLQARAAVMELLLERHVCVMTVTRWCQQMPPGSMARCPWGHSEATDKHQQGCLTDGIHTCTEWVGVSGCWTLAFVSARVSARSACSAGTPSVLSLW